MDLKHYFLTHNIKTHNFVTLTTERGEMDLLKNKTEFLYIIEVKLVYIQIRML